tara:strand:+ start:180 stop:359 length:180 start_codon:yes stop_codon:yes gene_type:complete
MNIVFRHMRWPCHFVWRGTERNWDTVRELLVEEIRENGFESFVLEETRETPPDPIEGNE